MSMELDEALAGLSAAPVHPGLTGIEDRVLSRVRSEAALAAQATQGLRIGAVAALAALGLGIAAGSPGAAMPSSVMLSPFGPASPLAPSTLLASDG